jgi:hypothetical protein
MPKTTLRYIKMVSSAAYSLSLLRITAPFCALSSANLKINRLYDSEKWELWPRGLSPLSAKTFYCLSSGSCTLRCRQTPLLGRCLGRLPCASSAFLRCHVLRGGFAAQRTSLARYLCHRGPDLGGNLHAHPSMIQLTGYAERDTKIASRFRLTA